MRGKKKKPGKTLCSILIIMVKKSEQNSIKLKRKKLKNKDNMKTFSFDLIPTNVGTYSYSDDRCGGYLIDTSQYTVTLMATFNGACQNAYFSSNTCTQ